MKRCALYLVLVLLTMPVPGPAKEIDRIRQAGVIVTGDLAVTCVVARSEEEMDLSFWRPAAEEADIQTAVRD